MKSTIRRAFIAGLCSLFAYSASAAANTVVVLEIDGGIGAATADYDGDGDLDLLVGCPDKPSRRHGASRRGLRRLR